MDANYLMTVLIHLACMQFFCLLLTFYVLDKLDVVVVTAVKNELDAVRNVLERASYTQFSKFEILNSSGELQKGGMSIRLQLQKSSCHVGVFCLFRAGQDEVANFMRAIEIGVNSRQVSESGLLVMVGMCAGFSSKVEIGTIMSPYKISSKRGKLNEETGKLALDATYAEVCLDVTNAVDTALYFPIPYGEYLPDEMKGTPSPRFLQDAILAELKKVQHEAMTVADLHTALSSAHRGWPKIITTDVVEKALGILGKCKRIHVSIAQDGSRKYSITNEGIRFIREIESVSQIFPRRDRSNPDVSIKPVETGDLVLVGMATGEQQAKKSDDVGQRTASGYEMEGYYFLKYARDHLPLKAWFVKTVTDHADEQSKMDYYQEYGTCLAAAFFMHVLKENPTLAGLT